MHLEEVIKALGLTVLTGEANFTAEVTGGYVSDLLSNVMGEAASGNIWITMQGHQNIVAVASLANLAAILVAGDAEISEDARQKAVKEGVALLATKMSSFETAGRLYAFIQQ
ncbi:MAG: serine kinase [Sporomusaceae bacterium]|nr:serine kinase [Sporomusaceae bacterium]